MKKLISLIAALTLLVAMTAVLPAFAAPEAYTDVSSWTISASSDGIGGIVGAFDNNPRSYWHTSYTVENGQIVAKEECPHEITVYFPDTRPIDGFSYMPRQINGGDNSSAGIWIRAQFYGSKDSMNFDLIATVTLSSEVIKSRVTAVSALPHGEYSAVKIVITDSQGSYGSAAEIQFLYGDVKDSYARTREGDGSLKPEPINVDGKLNTTLLEDRERWEITVDSHASWGGGGAMLDGKSDTFWHTNYTASGSTVTGYDPLPHQVDIVLPEKTAAAGFAYQTRTGSQSGMWLEYYLYGSSTDDGEMVEFYHGYFDDGFSLKTRFFDANVELKRWEIRIVDSRNGYATCSELYLVTPFAEYETVPVESYPAYSAAHAKHAIDTEKAAVTANCESWSDNYPKLMLDGREGRFWQSDSAASAPFVLDVNLSDVYEVSEIVFTPRQTSDFHGTWEKFNVYASTDGKNYTKVKENLQMAKSMTDKIILFDTPVKAGYFRFEITEGFSNKAACGELRFYENAESYEKRKTEGYEKYVLKIGSNEITATHGTKTSTVALDVSPYIYISSTLIPLRGLLEEMGATVEWDGDDQSIVITKNGKVIHMQIWNNLVSVEGTKYGTVRYTLPQYPRITNDRTFIPLRFVSEHLGYDVSWDGETQTITISKEVKD